MSIVQVKSLIFFVEKEKAWIFPKNWHLQSQTTINAAISKEKV